MAKLLGHAANELAEGRRTGNWASEMRDATPASSDSNTSLLIIDGQGSATAAAFAAFESFKAHSDSLARPHLHIQNI